MLHRHCTERRVIDAFKQHPECLLDADMLGIAEQRNADNVVYILVIIAVLTKEPPVFQQMSTR